MAQPDIRHALYLVTILEPLQIDVNREFLGVLVFGSSRVKLL